VVVVVGAVPPGSWILKYRNFYNQIKPHKDIQQINYLHHAQAKNELYGVYSGNNIPSLAIHSALSCREE
jgi:hypothetical protein